MGIALFALEQFVLRRNSGAVLRRLPFLPYFALRSALYVGILLSINELANRFASPEGRFVPIRQIDMLFSVTLCVGGNLLFSVNELLGPGVLFDFAAGRYHHPRREERVLLLIDMRSSTAIAERLGEARFLDFLNRFIFDVSLAIAAAGGEIHKYVGDEVIATWPLAPGPNEAGCVRACFAALERLAARRADYEAEFGLRADFRAGLHCGPLVVGELGYLKKEIALIGDAMNTAARILEACRETGCRVLASATLLERLTALPPGVAARARSARCRCAARTARSSFYALENKTGAAPATYWSQILIFERSVILKDWPLTQGDRICRDQTCPPRHSTGGLANRRGH